MTAVHDPNRHFGALGSGEALGRLAAFFATVYVARALGDQSYGVVALAAGASLYLNKLADFAIDYVGIIEVAGADECPARLASIILTTRLAFTTLLVIVAAMIVHFTVVLPERDVLMLYLLVLFPIAANTRWVHTGLHNTRVVGIARVLGELGALALVLLLVRASDDIWVPPVAQGAAEAGASLILLLALRRRGVRLRPRFDFAVALPIFRRAAPVVGMILLGLVLYNSDLVFLRVLKGQAAVGQYGAAYTLIGFCANLGLAYVMSLMPTLTQLGQDDVAGEREQYRRSLAEVFAVTVPLCIGGMMLSEPIIQLVFGSQYDQAPLALRVLMLSVPLTALRNVPFAALIARARQHVLFWVTLVAVLANVGLNLALVGRYGLLGAAVATVASECLACGLTLHYASRDGLAAPGLARLWRAALAALMMWLSLSGLQTDNLFLDIGIGVISFTVALTILGGIRFRQGRLPSLRV